MGLWPPRMPTHHRLLGAVGQRMSRIVIASVYARCTAYPSRLNVSLFSLSPRAGGVPAASNRRAGVGTVVNGMLRKGEEGGG